MSHSPIFDQLYTEFLEAHRVLPVRATMFFDSDKPEPVFDIPMVEETTEIPVVQEPTPSLVENVIAGLRAVGATNEIVVEETDEEWAESASEPAETFAERIQREIVEHLAKETPFSAIKLDIPVWMTEPEQPNNAEIKAADALSYEAASNPFVGLMNEHRHQILNPKPFPTREQIGWTPKEVEPAEEPAPIEEVQHVFPLTRGRHHKFIEKPVVAKLSDALKSVVWENAPA